MEERESVGVCSFQKCMSFDIEEQCRVRQYSLYWKVKF